MRFASQGGQAIYVGADVGQEEDVNRIADKAIAEFGGFDTWVNNAGVSLFGRCMDTLRSAGSVAH